MSTDRTKPRRDRLKRGLVPIASVALALGVASPAQASEQDPPSLTDVVREVAAGKLVNIGRDSGQPLTRAFLEDCQREIGPNHVELRCLDLTFPWHISRVPKSGARYLFVVSEEGASVENRWALEYVSGAFKDSTAEVWPRIPLTTISKRMIAATGIAKYTPEHLARVAHSSYRTRHPVGPDGAFDVLSGVPDQTFGTKLGELHWNGTSLELR